MQKQVNRLKSRTSFRPVLVDYAVKSIIYTQTISCIGKFWAFSQNTQSKIIAIPPLFQPIAFKFEVIMVIVRLCGLMVEHRIPQISIEFAAVVCERTRKKKTDVWPLCIIMFVLLNASNAIQWLQPIQNALKTTMRKKFQSCREQKKSELVWRSSSMQWAKKSFHWVCWSSDANVCSKNPRLRGTWLVHSSAFLQWAK